MGATVAAGPQGLLEREDVLAGLRQALGEARAGRGRLVLLSGEAGAGKTAATHAFCDEARASARVLWGACDALFTPRPLGPARPTKLRPVRRALVVGLVGVALTLVAPAVAGAGSSSGFRTPGKAAYCSVGGRTQATRHLLCFTPKSGLWIRLNGIGRRDGRAFLTLGHAERYVGARSSRPPVLRFGRSWAPTGARDVKCVSRRSGLTCRHDNGRGFWLGRSGGYRTY